MQQRAPISLYQAEDMLHYIDSHDREVWVQVGKALAAEFGDAAGDVFMRWSEGAANFKESSARTTWRSCVRKPGGYSMGTIVKLALEGNYRFERSEPPDQAELDRLRIEREARRKREAEERARAQLSAEQVALEHWRDADRHGRSEYVQRKGIEAPESCRFTPGGWLVVPMLRYDLPREQALKGVQHIRPDGQKRFTAGMAKLGAACRLGLAEVGAPVLLCEGWATGMSLRMAVDRRLPVYVAFDAGNLGEVAWIVSQLHPRSPLVLCADDDYQTYDKGGRPMNPGRVAAAEARDEIQEAGGVAVLTYPIFSALGRPSGSTDFNDLHLAEGLEVVRSQIELAVALARDLKHG
jgi:putative DNA primase/helicase